jgi:DNA-binding HxlR family transcriptional regulator
VTAVVTAPARDALPTRASSINRALDEIGDKWCLLILQEVFWGINRFGGMLAATGVSRGVLANRLRWLQQVQCLRRHEDGSYHLTRKSIGLHASAMMAIAWERRHHSTPELDRLRLVHAGCGREFSPRMVCGTCGDAVRGSEVDYRPGPGASTDLRSKKVRRRSSVSAARVPSEHSVYRNLIELVGDRWTANVIALAFHGHARFEDFHRELPVATNILSDRLKCLERDGILTTRVYRQRPRRFEYLLSDRGWDLYPYFLTLLQWGTAGATRTTAARRCCSGIAPAAPPCAATSYAISVVRPWNPRGCAWRGRNKKPRHCTGVLGRGFAPGFLDTGAGCATRQASSCSLRWRSSSESM